MALGDELWFNLPTKLDPNAVPMLVDFVVHKTLPPKETATLTAFNVAGYSARMVGLAHDEMKASGPASVDEEVAAVQALQAAAQGNEGPVAMGLPWKTILGIALKLLQQLLCLVLLLALVSPVKASDFVIKPGFTISTAETPKTKGCICGPTCDCLNCPRDCGIAAASLPIPAGVSYEPFYFGSLGAWQPAAYRPALRQTFTPPVQSFRVPVCVGGT